MNEKEFKVLLLNMLTKMDRTLKNIQDSTKKGIQIDLSGDGLETVVIPEDTYNAICDELGCEYIEFMGIS
tara:strand:+ start:576 stop:785 length:210 start_codon:yes stop_codon:yes gene_type:complete